MSAKQIKLESEVTVGLVGGVGVPEPCLQLRSLPSVTPPITLSIVTIFLRSETGFAISPHPPCGSCVERVSRQPLPPPRLPARDGPRAPCRVQPRNPP